MTIVILNRVFAAVLIGGRVLVIPNGIVVILVISEQDVVDVGGPEYVFCDFEQDVHDVGDFEQDVEDVDDFEQDVNDSADSEQD